MWSICKSDDGTAVEVLNIARNVQNTARMLEKVTTVTNNQKRVNSIFNGVASCSICQRSAPEKNLIAIWSSSGAPYAQINAGRTPKKLMKNI